jgi:hypothetical protein
MGVRRVGVAAAPLAVLGLGVVGLVGCDLGEPPTKYAVPGATVLSGDVDGDGDLDLVTSDPGSIGVLLGDGAGGFQVTTVPQVTACDEPGPEATCREAAVQQVVDVDGDGLDDLVVSYLWRESGPPGFPEIRRNDVRLADGEGGFGSLNGLPPGSHVVDVTGDGLVDLISSTDPFADGLPVRMVVRPGNGTVLFGAPLSTDLPGDHVAVGSNPVGDVDGDGHPDVVVDGVCFGGSGEQQIRGCADVLLGDGSGAFVPSGRLALADPAADGLDATLGDLDGDGDLDVAAATIGIAADGGGAIGSMSFFHGDGAGGFGPEVTRRAHRETTNIQDADFDGDGHVDLLTATSDRDQDFTDDYGRVLFGDGAGSYGDDRVLPNGHGAVADLDADGHPDYATFATPGNLEVFLNRLTP